MKKILIGALAALAIVGFSSFSEASRAAQENVCCRGGCYIADVTVADKVTIQPNQIDKLVAGREKPVRMDARL